MAIPGQADPAQKKAYTPEEASQLGLGWVDPNNPNYGQAGYVGSETGTQTGTAPAVTPGGAGGSTPIPGPAGSSGTPGQPQTINDAFRGALMTQLTAPVTAPTADDPTIKAQTDAFSLSQQRGNEREQNQLAESAAFDNTRTAGGFLSDKLGLEQQRAEAEGAFGADLRGRELQSRRDQVAQALQLGAGYLSDQEHQALQKQLADLDAAVRREGIQQQGSIASGDLALRSRLGEGQLNLGLLSELNNQQRSSDQLGYNYTALQTQANRDAILTALGR
jgi:hypothetical protein